MEHVSLAADAMPILYRAVLDLAYKLEQRGDRSQAVRLRAQAIATYSTAWDPRQRHQLERIENQLRRSLRAQPGRPA